MKSFGSWKIKGVDKMKFEKTIDLEWTDNRDGKKD